MDLKEAAEQLRALHSRPEPLVLPNAWDAASYPLTIEPEIFWRRGAPPKQRDVRVPDGR